METLFSVIAALLCGAATVCGGETLPSTAEVADLLFRRDSRLRAVAAVYREVDGPDHDAVADGYHRRFVAARAPNWFFRDNAHGHAALDWRQDPLRKSITIQPGQSIIFENLNRVTYDYDLARRDVQTELLFNVLSWWPYPDWPSPTSFGVPWSLSAVPGDANTSDQTASVVFLLSEGVLLTMLVRPTMGACCTLLGATAPLALGVAVSLLDTSIFEVRYLAFAQPFWLIAAAIAVCRVPRRALRTTLAAMLIGSLLFAHIRFWREAEFGQRPGAKGVAEFLDRTRDAGEPVVVCSQVCYYPILYHSSNTSDLWLFDDEHNVRRHSWGSAIIQPSELLSAGALNELRSPRVWLVELDGGFGPLNVPRGAGWRLKSERRFRGIWSFEGEYVVKEYENRRSATLQLTAH
ncbi:MAG TPA: hypothetical protein VNH11_13060 [Pirellulales bacterium]|nr:hypothetical protein [Pirellulales bacterium]